MDSGIEPDRAIIERVLTEYAKYPYSYGEIDRQLVALRERRLDRVERLLGQLQRGQPRLDGVRAEDVAVARRQDHAEAVVLERPRRVLA